jgi:hypothetical protein
MSERRFHLLLKFLNFVDSENDHVMKQGVTAKTVGWSYVLQRFQRYYMAADF